MARTPVINIPMRATAAFMPCQVLTSARPPLAGKPIDPSAVSVQTGKTYEQEFNFEMDRVKVSRARVMSKGSIARWLGWLACHAHVTALGHQTAYPFIRLASKRCIVVMSSMSSIHLSSSLAHACYVLKRCCSFHCRLPAARPGHAASSNFFALLAARIVQ